MEGTSAVNLREVIASLTTALMAIPPTYDSSKTKTPALLTSYSSLQILAYLIHMCVSKKRGTPILGYPFFGNTHILAYFIHTSLPPSAYRPALLVYVSA